MHLPHRVHHDGRTVGRGVDAQQGGDAGQHVGQRPRQIVRPHRVAGIQFQGQCLDEQDHAARHRPVAQPVGPPLADRQQLKRQGPARSAAGRRDRARGRTTRPAGKQQRQRRMQLRNRKRLVGRGVCVLPNSTTAAATAASHAQGLAG